MTMVAPEDVAMMVAAEDVAAAAVGVRGVICPWFSATLSILLEKHECGHSNDDDNNYE